MSTVLFMFEWLRKELVSWPGRGREPLLLACYHKKHMGQERSIA